MTCDQNPDILAVYLDGELPSDQSSALQQHIATCTDCAAEIAALVALRQNVRAARNHLQPSEAFRQKMRLQLSSPKPKPKMRFFAPLGLALAAMLLITAGWVLRVNRSENLSNTFNAVADLHVNALASSNPLDVVSTDRHTVKPWFQTRIPFSFNLPELANTEFTLLGGRLIYLHQQPGAQLIFSVRKHEISVLIFQSPSTPGSTTGVEDRNSFNVAAWHSQNLQFFVIGDIEPTEIRKLSDLMKQANQ